MLEKIKHLHERSSAEVDGLFLSNSKERYLAVAGLKKTRINVLMQTLLVKYLYFLSNSSISVLLNDWQTLCVYVTKIVHDIWLD